VIRRKNSNTKVENVEKAYDIELNSRGDMKLGNLLRKRGFDSQSQLVKAARGQLREHVRQRRLFLSFHYEDRQQVNGFRLLAYNENSPIDFHDGSVRSAVNSDQSSYLRKVIREKINKCSVLVCLVGDGTAWRDWVDWELATALRLGKGICGVRLKGSNGKAPDLLVQIGAPVANWNPEAIIAAIECAAARRS
jgi:MTH538 TIR-like domain (DUF1863)